MTPTSFFFFLLMRKWTKENLHSPVLKGDLSKGTSGGRGVVVYYSTSILILNRKSHLLVIKNSVSYKIPDVQSKNEKLQNGQKCRNSILLRKCNHPDTRELFFAV